MIEPIDVICDTFNETASSLGQSDPASAAFKDTDTKFLLNQLDPIVDGGLCNTEHIDRVAKAELLSNCKHLDQGDHRNTTATQLTFDVHPRFF